jgi:hypothetical protein
MKEKSIFSNLIIEKKVRGVAWLIKIITGKQ